MWFSKILNPERLKKIKGNRETFGFKADMLIIYNFFLTTSLRYDSYGKPMFTEVKTCSVGLVSKWVTSEIYHFVTEA